LACGFWRKRLSVYVAIVHLDHPEEEQNDHADEPPVIRQNLIKMMATTGIEPVTPTMSR
jgi:hypothetical protein